MQILTKAYATKPKQALTNQYPRCNFVDDVRKYFCRRRIVPVISVRHDWPHSGHMPQPQTPPLDKGSQRARLPVVAVTSLNPRAQIQMHAS